MIAVAMFDLGGTLLDETTMQVFPGVLDALGSIKNLHTSDQQPLRMAIVSNFKMPDGDAQPDQIKTLFDEYVAILEQAGMRPFFEPVESRVTLSTHVGVRKPDCRVFQGLPVATWLARRPVEGAVDHRGRSARCPGEANGNAGPAVWAERRLGGFSTLARGPRQNRRAAGLSGGTRASTAQPSTEAIFQRLAVDVGHVLWAIVPLAELALLLAQHLARPVVAMLGDRNGEVRGRRRR